MRDLLGNKTRTILVVLSIAVGIFAVGMIAIARINLSQGLAQDYAAINPASAMLMVSDPFFAIGDVGFDDDLVNVIRSMREIEEAEGRRRINVRLQVGPNEWRDLQLFAIPDYNDMRVNKISPQSGEWPPPLRTMLIERAALSLTNAQVGDTVVIKTPNGKLRHMLITGLTHDLSRMPAFMDGTIYGYITFDTLEWLGVSRLSNELHIVVATNKRDKNHIQQVSNLVKDKVEKSGRPVYFTLIYEPGQHPLDNIIQAIVLLLGILGTLALLLSGFLVMTTISAILAQHIQQIGILKAIGARRTQIMGMYFLLVAGFGLLAIIIAIPLSAIVAKAFTQFMANLFNFDLSTFHIPYSIMLLQTAIGLLVPVIVAFFPIWKGTRISVLDALNSQSLQQGASSKQKKASETPRFSLAMFINRPLLLSLRNTFRRKIRLALTLSTLTLSGAMFMSVFNIRDSLFQTLDNLMQIWQYDVWVTTSRPYPIQQLENETRAIPGVIEARGIGYVSTRLVRPNDSESDILLLFAPPSDSNMVQPLIVRGRWLLPYDEQGIVLSTAFVKNEPDVDVGSSIVLRIDGRNTTWKVVGISQYIAPFAFANYSYFSRVRRDVTQADTVWIVTEQHDSAYQAKVARMLEQHFEQQGIRISSVTKMADERAEAAFTFNIIVILLISMAILLALVGGLGLMGTMSINVLERTREIGIMRAVGASNAAITGIVLGEGMLVGVISWFLSALLAFVLSKPISASVGIALFQVPLSYAFSLSGVVIWFGTVCVLSALASFLPAWNAARLTVRDTLSYE